MADKLPELLAPAGSRAALEAAVEAGADAVYFGGTLFNARMNADNFTSDTMRDSVVLAHAHGVKCYLTLNTLVTDRELNACISAAWEARRAGIDGLIVADLGAAALIHKRLPDLPLHASTQASGHNAQASAELSRLGFSRMVMAREATLGDIRQFTAETSLELEVFVHGALCVCHSGQCLFSSLVGKRSGNRGECAQPCRLPFTKNGREYYPLSLRDLCLAQYVPELIGAGVSSLKIEGRMKPPEYVYAVTKIWRRLLDDRRAATPAELSELSTVFSRGGFTDGYFTGKIGSGMLGVRSESDKENTRRLPAFEGITAKVPLDIDAEFRRGRPSRLTLTVRERSVTVYGDEPQTALTAPMSAADFEKSLIKLGATPYTAAHTAVAADDGVMLPVSRLNALRRAAVEALNGGTDGNADFSAAVEALNGGTDGNAECPAAEPNVPSACRASVKTARFADPAGIPDSAFGYFDIIYQPLDRYDGRGNGVIMPPVVFSHEVAEVAEKLAAARTKGARHILVGNVGQLRLAREAGFELHGDFRLNVTNGCTAAALERLGVNDFIASPELTLPQLRDLRGGMQAIVYGRIPLMVLEKCVICEIGGCRDSEKSGRLCRAELVDRRGVRFPVFREGEHRNIIYNSLPTAMPDKSAELAKNGISGWHFIFSDEAAADADAVIEAYKKGTPLPQRVRRI